MNEPKKYATPAELINELLEHIPAETEHEERLRTALEEAKHRPWLEANELIEQAFSKHRTVRRGHHFWWTVSVWHWRQHVPMAHGLSLATVRAHAEAILHDGERRVLVGRGGRLPHVSVIGAVSLGEQCELAKRLGVGDLTIESENEGELTISLPPEKP